MNDFSIIFPDFSLFFFALYNHMEHLFSSFFFYHMIT